ncbi:MAG: hypothetical protein J5662_03395 [Clostridia bacterium]|nr:hypothetical protein [Clostridia bacterium]
MAYPFKLKVGNSWYALDGKDNNGYFPAIKYQGASVSLEGVDSASAGRNQNGTMIRDLVATKVKWQLEFVPCTQTQLKHLLDAVAGASFLFEYPDPTKTSGTTSTKYFYVGTRSAPVWKIDRSTSSGGLWGNVTMNFIEM